MSEKNRGKGLFEFANPSRVERILSRYPDKRSATLPLLHLVQSQEGYMTPAAIEVVAQLVDVHPSEIMDTLSFYTLFSTEPKGKYLLQVCQTLSCSLNGADELADHVCRKLDIQPGETTEDGKFTLMKAECLGSCDTAPVIVINSDYHERLTAEKLDKLLDSLP